MSLWGLTLLAVTILVTLRFFLLVPEAISRKKLERWGTAVWGLWILNQLYWLILATFALMAEMQKHPQ